LLLIKMPRYDDRHGSTRLYVGHLSSRTRSRDLEGLFSRYGRVRDVDMKHDYAFVEFSDPRDADDARYGLNGRRFDGTHIVVEFAKGVPRGSREYLGRGPPPGSGRCFNCGLDGHWARDCKAGDWKNKCYRCGDRGHIERNCQNSPKKLKRERSYSRSPVRSHSPRRGRSRSRSFSRSRSYSRSKSPPRREHHEKRPRSYSRSPEPSRGTPPPSKARKRSPTPEEEDDVIRNRDSPSPNGDRLASESPRANSGSPERDSPAAAEGYQSPERESPADESPERDNSPAAAAGRYQSPSEANGHGRSPSPRDYGSPVDGGDDDDDDNRRSPRGSESP